MIRELQHQHKFFATTEDEAKRHIAELKEKSVGDITKENITQKTDKNYGKYFEVVIVETISTSKTILESGV